MAVATALASLGSAIQNDLKSDVFTFLCFILEDMQTNVTQLQKELVQERDVRKRIEQDVAALKSGFCGTDEVDKKDQELQRRLEESVVRSQTEVELSLRAAQRELENRIELAFPGQLLQLIKAEPITSQHPDSENATLLAVLPTDLAACEAEEFREQKTAEESPPPKAIQAVWDEVRGDEVEDLDFGSSSFEDKPDECAAFIAEKLTSNTRATRLNLSRHCIGDDGAKSLAQMLKTNTKLNQFELTDTNIGDVGFACLAQALKVNTTLLSISLNNNTNISEDGIKALIKALEANDTVRLNIDSKFKPQLQSYEPRVGFI